MRGKAVPTLKSEFLKDGVVYRSVPVNKYQCRIPIADGSECGAWITQHTTGLALAVVVLLSYLIEI